METLLQILSSEFISSQFREDLVRFGKNSDSKRSRKFYKQGIKISTMRGVWNIWYIGESLTQTENQVSQERIEKRESIEKIGKGGLSRENNFPQISGPG